MNILAISGSLRSASSNTAVLRAAARLAPDDARVTVFEGIATLPYFNPDHDVDPAPVPVAEWRRAIHESDALLFSSPEYAHGVPGALKNALDWLVSGVEMTDKPVGMINTTPYAMYAPAALAETLRTVGARVLPEACVTFAHPLRTSDDGSICDDPACAEALRAALNVLASQRR
jgi:NAD(P)H-dependent FMN reductase